MAQDPNRTKTGEEEVGYAATMALEAVDFSQPSPKETVVDSELPISPEEAARLMAGESLEEAGATVPVSAEQAEAMLAELSGDPMGGATVLLDTSGIPAGPAPNDARRTQIESPERVQHLIAEARAAQQHWAQAPRTVAPTLAERAVTGPQPMATQNPGQRSTQATPSTKKQGSKGLLLAIVLVAVLLVAGIAFLLAVALL